MSDYYAFFKQKNANMYIECMKEGEVLLCTLEAREKMAAKLHKSDFHPNFRIKITQSIDLNPQN